MVKQTFVAFSALAFMVVGTSVSFAAHPDTGPGCGLGKLAWSNYPDQQHIGTQVMQATTNGTFGSQTFGISSGTSGCTNDGVIVQHETVDVFAALNFESISQEMAQGRGEHLTSLATLMDIPEDQHEDFFVMTQAKYASLIRSGEPSPKAVVKAIYSAMADHPVLAQSTLSR